MPAAPPSAAPPQPAIEACPSCGAPVPLGEETCSSCGQIVAPGERRLLTILFVDLTGYTALAARLDPEDVHAFIRPAMNDLVRLVEGFGGTVPQVMGDGFMAVFGYPVAHEDDAERAVRAALEAVAFVRRRNAGRDGPPLPEVHAGINSGEVLVASSWEPAGFAVVGDVVNVASRLAGLATAGKVVAGERTVDMAGHAIRFGRPVLRQVRGKAERLRVHEALAPVSLLPEGHVAPVRPAGFVGRSDSLSRLGRELRAVAARLTSRVVIVRGEAGMGKTRLGEAFLSGLRDLTALAGRCRPYGPVRPLGPVVDAFEGLIGLTAQDPSARTAEVEAWARRIAPPSRAGWVAGRLRVLLGLETAPPDVPPDLPGAARAVLESIASLRPTVLLVDDLQWADPQLVDWIRALAGSPWPVPLLVVGLARPDLPSAGLAGFSLRSLNRDELEALVRATVAEGLPSNVTAKLVHRSGGNPLFLQEAIRMLRTRAGWFARAGVGSREIRTSWSRCRRRSACSSRLAWTGWRPRLGRRSRTRRSWGRRSIARSSSSSPEGTRRAPSGASSRPAWWGQPAAGRSGSSTS